MGNQSYCDCLGANKVRKPKTGSELQKPVSVMSKSTAQPTAGLPGTSTEEELEAATMVHGFPRATVMSSLLMAEMEFAVLLGCNPATDPLYSKLLEKDGVTVYAKDTPGGFLIHSQWRTTTPPSELLRCINSPSSRLHWDKNVQKMAEVALFDEYTKALHIEYRKSFPVSARDLLIACKTTCSGRDWLDISCSVESEEFPMPGGDVVRATLVLGGYQFRWEGSDWSVTGISELRFGGKVPMILVKQLSAANVPTFVKNLHKACSQTQ